MGKIIFGIGLIFVGLLVLAHGGFAMIFGLIGGVVGLVTGIVGAVFGVAAGLFGAVIGVAATIFGLALPLIIVVVLVAGVVHLFKLV